MYDVFVHYVNMDTGVKEQVIHNTDNSFLYLLTVNTVMKHKREPINTHYATFIAGILKD